MKLKEIREELGISQKELAEKMQVSPTNIYNYETGRTEPSIEVLLKLSKILNTSVDYLIGNEDDFRNIVISGSEKKETLSLKEQRLLKAFNKLSDPEKEKLIEDAEFYAKRYATNPENRNK